MFCFVYVADRVCTSCVCCYTANDVQVALYAVLQGGAAVAAPVSGGHTSPVGTMVASLLAETAGAAHSVVNTPW